MQSIKHNVLHTVRTSCRQFPGIETLNNVFHQLLRIVPSPAMDVELSTLLRPTFPFLDRLDRQKFYEFVLSVRPDGAPVEEMKNYAREDFQRFFYTYGLLHDKTEGKCLEIGSNPYFMTMLLTQHPNLELTLTNYFGGVPGKATQKVFYADFQTQESRETTVEFDHFNIEDAQFPYDDKTFDTILFCEVIEHLIMDPQKVLLEIKRVLKHDGILILTTPNVARLENIARLVSGANIYDPYSGYGIYGRHNREYTRHELYLLLSHSGFECETSFTADVHANRSAQFFSPEQLFSLISTLKNRQYDLGQYLFIRAKNTCPPKSMKKPDFLYRSYPPEEIDLR